MRLWEDNIPNQTGEAIWGVCVCACVRVRVRARVRALPSCDLGLRQ